LRSQHRARHGLGAFSPPGRGANQQCPLGAPPPVKSLTLGLHHPWLRPRPRHPWRGQLDRLAVWLPEKRGTFPTTARGEFLRRARILYIHYLPLFEAPDKRGTPISRHRLRHRLSVAPVTESSSCAVISSFVVPCPTLSEPHDIPRGNHGVWEGSRR